MDHYSKCYKSVWDLLFLLTGVTDREGPMFVEYIRIKDRHIHAYLSRVRMM